MKFMFMLPAYESIVSIFATKYRLVSTILKMIFNDYILIGYNKFFNVCLYYIVSHFSAIYNDY